MSDSNKFSNIRNIVRVVLPVMSMVIVAAIILPIPAPVLDILIAMNLVFAAVILTAAICVKKVTKFPLYPMVILVLTLFNLAVNISATRLILIKGADFDGRLIRFASSWIADSGGIVPLVVGFVIFIAVLAIRILLITKEATRVSEVAARFTLDSMPGKQMAIDVELSVVTILAGIIIHRLFFDGPGEWQLMDAVMIYVPLAIGNGLVFMIPAFLLCMATVILITRSVFAESASGD